MKKIDFSTFFLCTAFAVSGCVLARAAYIDPYWIFRKTPIWIDANGLGQNNIIDLQMRKAKLLHLLTYRFDSIYIGSSVVYRGIDAKIPHTYNAGISSLMSNEIEEISNILNKLSYKKSIYIGLDYFMFTNIDVPVKIEFNSNIYEYTLKMIGNANFSFINIENNTLENIAKIGEKGGWKVNGFRVSPDRQSDYTVPNNKSQRDSVKAYDTARRAHIEQALHYLRKASVVVYLSPVSRAHMQNIHDAGFAADFDRWRQDMRQTVIERGATFHDLVDLDTADDFEPENGSSATWLDTLHFKPVVGQRVQDIVQKKM